ncbi:macro domain-containing protein [Ditylenchus destructor]|nr:macro domain-containing protein [Ditylenchus destructor]
MLQGSVSRRKNTPTATSALYLRVGNSADSAATSICLKSKCLPQLKKARLAFSPGCATVLAFVLHGSSQVETRDTRFSINRHTQCLLAYKGIPAYVTANDLNMRVITIQMKLDFVLFLILFFHDFGTVFSSNTQGIDSGPVDTIEVNEGDHVRDKRSTHHRSHKRGGRYSTEADSVNGIDGYKKARGDYAAASKNRGHKRQRSDEDGFGRHDKKRKASLAYAPEGRYGEDTKRNGHHQRNETDLGRDGYENYNHGRKSGAAGDSKYDRAKGAYDTDASLPTVRHHGHKKDRDGYADDYQRGGGMDMQGRNSKRRQQMSPYDNTPYNRKKDGFSKSSGKFAIVHEFTKMDPDWINGVQELNRLRHRLGKFELLTLDQKLADKVSKGAFREPKIYSTTIKKPGKSVRSNLVKGIKQIFNRLLYAHLNCKSNTDCVGRKNPHVSLPFGILESQANKIGCVARLFKKANKKDMKFAVYCLTSKKKSSSRKHQSESTSLFNVEQQITEPKARAKMARKYGLTIRGVAHKKDSKQPLDGQQDQQSTSQNADGSLNTVIQVEKGDIVKSKVEAIVNPSNPELQLSTTGVNGNIQRSAGPQLLQFTKDNFPNGIKPGKAIVTPSFDIGKHEGMAKKIIHTTGPKLTQGAQPTADDERILASCYRECLDLAKSEGIKSIAFPSVSSGENHFPKDKAAMVAITTVAEWLRQPENAAALDKITFTIYHSPEDEKVC